MGLLDDAIREHLELKRRRGADPEEIERLEREVLSPVRRRAEGADATLEPGEAALGYEDEPFGHGDDLPVEPLNGEDMPYGVEAAPAEEPPEFPPSGEAYRHEPEPSSVTVHESRPSSERVEQVELGSRVDWEHQEPSTSDPVSESPAPHRAATEPPVAPPPSPAVPEPELGGETVEYDVEAEHESHVEHGLEADLEDEHGEAEDVLEETPEFLQDTPDHDRLWFEQRPPKDFDFDG